MEIDRYAALKSVCDKLSEMSCSNAMESTQIRQYAALALDLDLAFMLSSGVLNGEEYDDSAAYEYISKGLSRYDIDESFVEDYMEAMESYLESVGGIAWDGK